MEILKFRNVFHIKLMCRHQNKTCQNGVDPDLTKMLLLNRGRKGKPTPFWRPSKIQVWSTNTRIFYVELTCDFNSKT